MAKKKPASQTKKTKKSSFKYKRPFWSQHWLPCLVLFVLALAIYLPSINYEFVLDDQIVISDNNYTKQGIKGIGKIFSSEGFMGYFGEQKNLVAGARYRPLSMAMFALEYEAFGGNPMGYHLINVLLYGLLCILIYRIALIYLPRFKKSHILLSFAFLTSLLYLAHPVHTECVANIKGRDEILAMLGSMGVMYLVARYLNSKKMIWLGLTSLCFFAALFAKENSLTFLAVVPLAMYFFTLADRNDYIKVGASLLIATAAYLAIRYSVIGYLIDSGVEITDVMNNPFLGMSAAEKSATIFFTLGEYLRLLSFPLTLTHDYYPYHVPIMEWSDIGSLLSLLAYIVLGFTGIYGLWKKKFYGFCIAFYIATLSIVSNLVFPIGTFMNERFLFMPSWGYCLLLVYLVTFWLPPKIKSVSNARTIGIGFLLLVATLFTVRSVVRVPVWKSPLSLNTSAIKVSKNSARANVFVGTAKYKIALAETDQAKKKAMLEEVTVYFQNAVDILPYYLNGNKMKAGASAQLFQLDKDVNRMLTDFKDVASRRPDIGYIHEYCDYLYKRGRNTQELTDFFFDVGYNVLYRNAQTRNTKWAQTYLNYGLQMSPNDARLLYAMYLWHNSTNRQAQAAEFLRRAQAINPNIAQSFN